MGKRLSAWWAAYGPTKRRLIQVYAALLYNAHAKGFIQGDIYTGPIKNLCVPGLNCYSCPGAIGACPLGALQNALAATGSRPFVPPIPGLETVERTFCFQTLSDASALAEALRPESRVLILGAGLTGVKCAEGIRGLCAQIAIADLAPRVLPAVLDDTAAAMVQARMEEKGVRFYLNDSAAAFRETRPGSKAERSWNSTCW